MRHLLLLLTAISGLAAVPHSDPNGLTATQDPSSTLLFTLQEHDLYPENIAYDPVTGDFFLGSMGQSRILRIHPDGSYEDFVSHLEPLLQSSVGMKVDAGRRRLWVCSGRYTLFGGSTEDPPQTGVLLFDLDSGALLASWMMDQPSPPHIFNDITLTSSGDAYVTTTLFGQIFRISPDRDEMELVLETPGSHNNGIALGPGEGHLFFTLDRTISRLDLETGELIQLETPEGADLGTDGLYYRDGSLIVMKPRLSQILHLKLNEGMDTVVDVEVLAEGEPEFAYPTTGVVMGDRLVFVATSFADIPRNPQSVRQHPAVRIHELELEPARRPLKSP